MRTINYSDQFCAQRSKIEPDCRRFDEAIDAWEWGLSRHPERGCPTDDSRVFASPLDSAGDLSPMTAYYTYDDQYVTLIAILVMEASDNGTEGT